MKKEEQEKKKKKTPSKLAKILSKQSTVAAPQSLKGKFTYGKTSEHHLMIQSSSLFSLPVVIFQTVLSKMQSHIRSFIKTLDSNHYLTKTQQYTEELLLHYDVAIASQGVVYKIPCECGRIYVGETGRTLKQRITEHKRAVKSTDSNNGLLCM